MPLSEYEPKFLATQELLISHWPQVAPLLEKAPIVGPYSTNDILGLAIAHQLHIFVVSADTAEGPDVKLVVVLAPAMYPNLAIMNIVTVAGSHLKYFASRFWEMLKGWSYMNGARVIDAHIPAALEPIMKELGFIRESIHVRTSLK